MNQENDSYSENENFQFHEEEEEEENFESSNEQNNISSPPKGIKPLHERSIRGFLIFISKNTFPKEIFKRYIFTSIEKLLNDSVSLLSLNGHAKKVYNEDGKLVKDDSEIRETGIYYISCGEKFAWPPTSPVKRSPPRKEIIHDDAEESNEQKNNAVEPPKQLTKLEKRQLRFSREILSFQRILAITPRTMEETMRISTASVFQALGENQKRRLPNSTALEIEHNETQQALLINALINQKMAPSSNKVMPELEEHVIDMLKALDINDVRFVITGPKQSGKTTLLYTLSRLLFRKIQVSDEASSYLVFPINFEFQTLDLSNHNTFLRLFVRVLFDSLEYSNMAFIPYLQQLKKWFIMTVYGTQMQFPNGITQLGNVNKDALNSIAKGLNAALKGTGVHGLENFIQKVCSLPDEFAKALGFHGVLFLLDSFEYCDFFFYPGESFPESLKPVSLAQSLSNVLSNSLYIISLKDEEHFMECFSCDNAALIDTEGFLGNLIAPYEIVVRQPPFTLKFEDCLGCSGYIAAFDNIVHHGLSIRENTETSHYATLRTSADFARSKVVKQELSRFCQLLYKAGNTNITKDLLNNLVNAETISISIINKEPNEEEEDQEEESSKQAKLEAVNIVEDDAQSTATVDDI